MKDDEARRISVNHCVRDDELEEIRRLRDGADAGDWRVAEGKIERYGGAPMVKPEGTLAFVRRCITAVPRLLKGIAVLEEEVRRLWNLTAIMKREAQETRERHEAELARAFQGKTGPDYEVEMIAEAFELGALRPGILPRMLRDWASGVEIQQGYYAVDLDRARRDAAERRRARAEHEAEYLRREREVDALLAELKLKKREREEVAARVRAKLASSDP